MVRRVALILILGSLLASLTPIGVIRAESSRPTVNPQASPCVTAAAAALAKRGSSYVWGGKGPSSFDCSGIVYFAWKQAGFDIGVSTYNQATAGTRISCGLGDLNGSATTCWAPGDLIFLSYTGGQHVAIYINNGLFMDCYNTDVDCILHNVKADSFYQAHFWQARRIVMNCGGSVTGSGSADPLPNIEPGIEQIPNLFPLVYFEVPQCGECNASGVDPLPASPEPSVSFTDPTSPFYWLAWRIGEYLRLLLCFLLQLLQLLANLLQTAINALLDALNAFWRLAVYLWLQFKAAVISFWLLISDLYGAIINLAFGFDLGDIGTYIAMLWSFLVEVFFILGNLLLQIGALALVPLQLVGWLVAVVLSPLVEIVNQVLFGTTVPTQLAGGSHPIYQAVRGMQEGIIASKIGWAMYLMWGLCYVGFILWLARVFGAGNLPE